MSLFAAFTNELDRPRDKTVNSDSESTKESWLKNASYTCVGASSVKSVEGSVTDPEISRFNEPATHLEKRHGSKSPRRHKKKKRKISKSRKSLKDRQESIDSEVNFERLHGGDPTVKFYDDRKKEEGNLNVNTLCRPAVPTYSHQFWVPIGTKCSSSIHPWKISGKQGRYFLSSVANTRVKICEGIDSGTEEEAERSDRAGEGNKEIRTSKLEKELQDATECFHQRLAEHPHDVNVWLEFLKFQEHASEVQFRGGCSKMAMAQRKIDILEKAFQENPRSWLLLREKIYQLQILYPPDELEEKLGKEAKESNNLSTWIAYLEVLRDRSTTTEVTINYGKTMEAVRREGRLLGKGNGDVSAAYDERIIDLLLGCGLYMRQAGLWERLWTLIRTYLELNLKPADNKEENLIKFHFDIEEQPNDMEMEELEAEVFKSGLPLSEIWLRVEGLRQSVRWFPLLPSNKNEAEGDLQRIVFPEDVSELVHPLSSAGKVSGGIFPRLASVALLLLKVPLLPCRDTALRRHGFPSWSCDTPEFPLAAIFSGGPWDWATSALPFDLLGEMIAGGGGPQYLLPRPGRDLYLRSIQRLFLIFTEVVGSAADQQCFGVWWLRFERWLLMLEGYKSPNMNFSLPQKWKKHLKATLKEFLSREKNRSSLALYREYALIEAALDKKESAIRTLCTAATLGGSPVIGGRDQAELCSVYRTLVELLLKQGLDVYFSSNKNIQSRSSEYKIGQKDDEIQILKQNSFTKDSEDNNCSHCESSNNQVVMTGFRADCDISGIDYEGPGDVNSTILQKMLSEKRYCKGNMNDIVVVKDPCSSSVCYESNERDSSDVLLGNTVCIKNKEIVFDGENPKIFNYSVVDQTLPSRDLSFSVNQGGDSVNCLVEGADTADVISLKVKNVDIDSRVKKKSEWSIRNSTVGTGRSRWSDAGGLIGSADCYEKDNGRIGIMNEIKKSKVVVKKLKVGESERDGQTAEAQVPLNINQVSKEKLLNVIQKVHSSSFEQMAITVLTCLGLGKPLGSLEVMVDKSEIMLSLQKYKNVFQEILREEVGSCWSPESHEKGCKYESVSRSMECFQSYLLVEWVCCMAWLLCLVESTWAAGGVFEEALSKLVKISVEQMDEVAGDIEEHENRGTSGGRYNPAIVRARNIREALYEGYISMLLSRRWSQEGQSGLNVILADVIRRALGEFPENLYFAGAVAISENEVGYGGSPWWTVTSYFDHGLGRLCSSSRCVFGKIFLVLLAEQRRRRVEQGMREGHQVFSLGGPMVNDCSATNRLRSVLSRLVVDSGTKSCPLLWRLYIRFVGAVAGIEDCKRIAYRGLQQCPWVKAFYLDAARLLPEEIGQFQDLITEKELRLHISPEELEILRA